MSWTVELEKNVICLSIFFGEVRHEYKENRMFIKQIEEMPRFSFNLIFVFFFFLVTGSCLL